MAWDRSGRRASASRAIILAPAAVANAMFNAIGRRMKDLPVTRDRISWGRSHESPSRTSMPRDLGHASELAAAARREQNVPSFAGGGSDLLGLIKDRVVAPDVIVNLKDDQGAWTRSSPTATALNDRRAGHARRPRAPRRLVRRQYARARRGRRKRGHAADSKRRHARGQRLPAALVLVLPQRIPLPEGRRHDLLLGRRREPVSRHLRRRAELHRSPVGYGACARRPGRAFRVAGLERRADGSSRRVLRAAESRCRTRERARRRRSARRRCALPAPRTGDAQRVSQGPRPRGLDARRGERRGRPRDGRRRLPRRAHRARGRRAGSLARPRGRACCWRASASRRSSRRGPARSRWPARGRSRRTATRCR